MLFVTRKGEVLLFYKVGRTPAVWRGYVLRSADAGKTWGAGPETLPDGVLGPVKNKPIQLLDGTVLCPSSVEKGPRGKEWEVYVESTADDGYTWRRHGPIQLEGRIIQPSLFLDADDRVRALIRSRKQYMAGGGRAFHSTPLFTVDKKLEYIKHVQDEAFYNQANQV